MKRKQLNMYWKKKSNIWTKVCFSHVKIIYIYGREKLHNLIIMCVSALTRTVTVRIKWPDVAMMQTHTRHTYKKIKIKKFLLSSNKSCADEKITSKKRKEEEALQCFTITSVRTLPKLTQTYIYIYRTIFLICLVVFFFFHTFYRHIHLRKQDI